MDELFGITKKEMDEAIAFLSDDKITESLTLGEQMLIMAEYAKLIRAIKPIMENHKNDLVQYRITRIDKR